MLRMGLVRRLDGPSRQVRERLGWVVGEYGITRAITTRHGVVSGVAFDGVALRWQVYAQPSGAHLASARTFRVASAIVADLLADVPAGTFDHDFTRLTRAERHAIRRLVGPVLARWACEGDAVISDGLKVGAVEVAAATPGWGAE